MSKKDQVGALERAKYANLFIETGYFLRAGAALVAKNKKDFLAVLCEAGVPDKMQEELYKSAAATYEECGIW